MPQIVQLGSVNLAALSVPDLIVQIVPPQLLINGVPSNIIGIVGTAAWGPTNVPQIVGAYSGYVPQFGLAQPRKYDAGTPVWTASLQGASAFRIIRVTDGSDVAASITVQTNCITFTSKWTGSNGNAQQANISTGSAAGSYKLILSTPYNAAEMFDNITQGVVDFTMTTGTWTVCPTAYTIGAPNQSTGIQAQATPSLGVTGAVVVATGSSGFAVNDTITLANGVVLKLSTAPAGVAGVATVQNAGSIGPGLTVPANPASQIATSGVGVGTTTWTLTWGLNKPTVATGGSGYTSAPTGVFTGGTFSVAGSATPVISFWKNMADAVNNGQSGLRGPSLGFIATAGVGVSTPTVTNYTLTGGTDGASPASIGAAGLPKLVGQDVVPRTGMYAMRSALISIGMLADADDSTTWTTQTALGLGEGIYMVGTGPVSDTIANAGTVLNTAGVDSYAFKLMFGDWVYINDPVTGAQRLVSPQGFVVGLMGNQAPNQSTLNKPLFGIVGTQKSNSGLQYTSADLQALAAARIDVLANPSVGGNYYSARLGLNTSSNAGTREDSYTRLTNFIAQSVAKGLGIYVGQLQTPDERLRAKTTLQAFFGNLQSLGLIGTADGSPAYQVVLDSSNNPQNLVALGYQFAYVKVVYFAVIRYFIVNLEGGQTVVISAQPPSLVQSPLALS